MYAACVGRRWWILVGLSLAIVIAVATQPGFTSRAPEIVVWMAAYVVAWVRAYLPIVAVIIVGLILIALSIRRRQDRI